MRRASRLFSARWPILHVDTAQYRICAKRIAAPRIAASERWKKQEMASFASPLQPLSNGATSIAETPIHEYLQAGVYDVSLTADNTWGCSTTFTLPEAVLAEEGGMMVFPNAFTPSSTGSTGGYYDANSYDNDVFRPMHVGIETYELMVFTKWGEMIFHSNEVGIGWDGYVQGKLAATDVYAWKATATLSNGERLQQLGNVTLLAR